MRLEEFVAAFSNLIAILGILCFYSNEIRNHVC